MAFGVVILAMFIMLARVIKETLLLCSRPASTMQDKSSACSGCVTRLAGALLEEIWAIFLLHPTWISMVQDIGTEGRCMAG